MAMSAGGAAHRAQINVTPMIDVLLVLIIIFMVIAPLTPRGLNATIPQTPRAVLDPPPTAHDIVITVLGGRTVRLNREPVDLADLSGRLNRIFQNGGDNVIFVRGEGGLEFRQVAEVMDIARGAGVKRVGLMTR